MGLPQGFYAGIILELVKGAFFNYVDKILAIFDHLPSYVDIFYLIRVYKKSTITYRVPTYLLFST